MNLDKKQKVLNQINKILNSYHQNLDSCKNQIICVTGKMAAGKNFVCSLFEQYDFFSIDLDAEVHKVIKSETNKIFDTFEKLAIEKKIRIRNDDNSLNTKQLGTLLFSDKKLLQTQEQIIYPVLTKNILQLLSKTNKNIILNATVLYKTPELLNKCNFIVYVQSNTFKRIIRAKKRDKLELVQILKRFISQKKLKIKYLNKNIPLYTIKN